MTEQSPHRRAALDLLDGAKGSPKETLAQGARLLPKLRATSDDVSAAIALRAMGDAARYAATLPESMAFLEDSIAAARTTGDSELVAESQLTLAGSQAISGDMDGALATLEVAGRNVDGLLAARIGFQRGAVLARAGRKPEAAAALDAALPLFRDAGDSRFVAMTLHNRGTLRSFAGDFGGAEADLLEARELGIELGMDSVVAGIDHNLGQVAAYRGDLPSALAHFNDSEARFARLTGTPWESQVSRCEALLSAGLFDDALLLARDIRHRMHDVGLGADEAEATLVLAQAALLAGDLETATESARAARSQLAGQGRPGWLAAADYVLLQAMVGSGKGGARMRSRVRAAAKELRNAGQFIPAAGAGLLAARLSLGMGDLDAARSDVAAVARHRSHGPVELRVQAWLSLALLRRAEGNPRGAAAAATAGVRLLAEHQEALGATDVRVGVAQHGAELGALGLEMAVASGNPRRVWSWMEKTRAGALRFRPVRPPSDDELADWLAEMRLIASELRGAGPDEARLLQRRQQALQDQVRQRGHELAGVGSATWVLPEPGEVLAGLGSAHLVEIGVVGSSLLAVTLGSGRARLTDLGPWAPVEKAFASLRLALGRLSRSATEANVELVQQVARRLDDLLLQPQRLGEGDLVIVPPARLMTVPWSLLPGASGRAVTVAPATGLWMAARRRPFGHGRTVLAAGPGLDFATPEVRDLAALYPDASRFSASRSHVSEVLDAIDGAGTAHLATHGTFRADNPLFSSLQLADGDLTVFDLEGLEGAPELIVLSACQSGLSAARPGDELLGLSGALLALGTKTLIASIGLVPDTAATRRLVREFHGQVASGARPAQALAVARERVAATPAGFAASAAFVCFGSG